MNDSDFINRDFTFDKYEVKVPFWSNEKIAEINLTYENIGNGNIEIGQFDETGRYWSEHIVLSPPRSVEISTLTDDNWTNGYHNTTNYLLVKTPSIFNTLLNGKEILLPDGTKTVIDEVKNVGDYQWLHTVDNIAQYSLSTIQISNN